MKNLIVVFLFVFLASCTAPSMITKTGLTLPDAPKALVIDNGKIDKTKYPPKTEWVKMPKIDLNKKTATWSLDDMNKISKSVADWQGWSGMVKEKANQFNRELQDHQWKLQNELDKPWYKKVW